MKLTSFSPKLSTSRHTCVVVEGNLYSWGDNEAGTTGIGSREGHQYTPKLIDRLEGKRVVQLSACGFHTGCLLDPGQGAELELYTFGEGKFGRLGTGNERNCHAPHLVETLVGKRPKQVSCGGFHTAIVTEDGKLYTTGGGEHGQLGHNDRVNRLKPTLVQALQDEFVSEITCGWSHSVALISNSLVYSWGNSDHGKLGVGSSRRVSVPQQIEKLSKYRVKMVRSYNEHTTVLVEPFDRSGLAGGVNAVPVTTAYSLQLCAMVNDEEFSDVSFTVEDQPIYAHRALLAQRCEHFAAMFRSGMRESAEKAVIPIPNMSRRVFMLLLEYIYTDSVKIEVDQAIDLFVAADLYQLERLREMCCTVVRRNLNAENSGPLLQSATESHCHTLKEVCMAYVVENFDLVSKTEGIKEVCHSLLLEILAQR